ATDVDGDAAGIVVTNVDDSHGSWEYSVDGGASWQAFGAVSDAAAVALGPDARVRFVPDPDLNTEGTGPDGGTDEPTITFRAWDLSDGQASGATVDASTNGDTTAYSAASGTASIAVAAVNDAPVLDDTGGAALTGIAEDVAAADNPGTLVSDLL